MDISLQDPNFLLINLIFIPALFIVLWSVRLKQLKLVKRINVDLDARSLRLWPKVLISGILVALFSLALAQPQLHSTKVKHIPVRFDTQIAFLMDVSLSMAGSKEANPCVNKDESCSVPEAALLRIERAKKIIKNTIDSLGVVSVGVYAFSNKTVWQIPFSYSPQKELLDYGLTAGSLQSLCNNKDKCSDFGQAIYAVASDFKREYENKIIVLLSDGDSETPFNKATLPTLKYAKIKVFAVSMGTKDEHIWLYDKDGNPTGYYFPRPLEVKEADLTLIAQETEGQIFREEQAEFLPGAILSALGSGGSVEYRKVRVDINLSPVFFFLAMIVLVVFTLVYLIGVHISLFPLRSFKFKNEKPL